MFEILLDRNKATILAQRIYTLLDDWNEGEILALIINPKTRQIGVTLVHGLEGEHVCPDCQKRGEQNN